MFTSPSILPGWPTINADDPTFAQQVAEILGDRVDVIVNDPDSPVACALVAAGVEAALTVEHLVELFVLRPLFGLVGRAVAR